MIDAYANLRLKAELRALALDEHSPLVTKTQSYTKKPVVSLRALLPLWRESNRHLSTILHHEVAALTTLAPPEHVEPNSGDQNRAFDNILREVRNVLE